MIRFRLSTMLLLITLIGLWLGYAHWRRYSILQEDKELEADGVRLLWATKPSETIWPVIPPSAILEFSEVSPNEIRIGDGTYTLDEAYVRSDAIMERLHRFGVDFVVPVKNGQRLNFEVPTE